jgi:hypothetical protein
MYIGITNHPEDSLALSEYERRPPAFENAYTVSCQNTRRSQSNVTLPGQEKYAALNGVD